MKGADMSIVQNIPCPACMEMGHDRSGNHMIVFEDGGKYCNRAHWHKDGLPLYIPPEGGNPILDIDIDGTIKYTAEQFKELEKNGKFVNDVTRAIALSGMRGKDRWDVATEEERQKMIEERIADEKYFNMLKIRNLVDRHIPGQIAKLYNVRVGLDTNNKTARHYYPVYDKETGEWRGAKCRNLPKDFRYGHLGWLWGDNMLFGQHITADVMKSGARMDTLLLVGGECDAMAAQHMLVESKKDTKWKGSLSHVWSPTKGECALQEIILNKDAIKKFDKIIVGFDDDATGQKLNTEVAKLFRGKVKKLVYPSGSKDANACLKQGREKEFVDAWWKPVDPFEGGTLSSMDKYREKAKILPVMGLSWPWPSMDAVTYGIRKYHLSLFGAGTGVGKTKVTKEIVFHLAYTHNVPVVVIYLEEQAQKTVRSFAGQLINKELVSPPCNDKDDPNYTGMRDYTIEEANAAVDKLCDDGMIMIGDLEGRKDVGSVMEVMEEALAMGYEYFIIDNLTAFEHKGIGGGNANKVEAIDETMKKLGTFKDENPVWIGLLSHLKRVYGDRKTHEEGGRVIISDFRGAGSITFWANDIWGIERDTTAENIDMRCLTTFRNIKNRDVGYKAGTCVYASLNLKTGNLRETKEIPQTKKGFDDGTKSSTTNNEEF